MTQLYLGQKVLFWPACLAGGLSGSGDCGNKTSQSNWRLWLANWAELGKNCFEVAIEFVHKLQSTIFYAMFHLKTFLCTIAINNFYINILQLLIAVLNLTTFVCNINRKVSCELLMSTAFLCNFAIANFCTLCPTLQYYNFLCTSTLENFIMNYHIRQLLYEVIVSSTFFALGTWQLLDALSCI